MASSAALTTTHLPRLRAELGAWRAKQPVDRGFATPLTDIPIVRVDASAENAQKDIVVAFRTRPPLAGETSRFQSVSREDPVESTPEGTQTLVETPPPEFCAGITVASSEPGTFVAHVPGVKWNGPTLTHKSFTADLAFGPAVENEEVYQRTIAANELLALALSGGIACVLAYGQTGSGKTYTMEALEHRIARDLFAVARVIGKRLRAAGGTLELDIAGDADVFEFSVTFVELLGRKAVDLLEPAEGLPVDAQGNAIRKEVVIQENKGGEVKPKLISTGFHSSEELEGLIITALAHRRVSATARNATSSRSHAVLTIRIKNKLLPYADEGQLLLVDLAGSERYEDSKLHDKQRMDESRDNNKSLMNLKECVRAKAKMANEDGFVHIPWRMNKLTTLLKPIFDPESRQSSRTLIIAHVSPHIQDSAHSVSTLSYAAPFRTLPPRQRGPAPYSPDDPRTWDHAQTAAWLTQEFTKRTQMRRAETYEIRKADAVRHGEELAPLDVDAPVALMVDIDKLCPVGTTARSLVRLYTTEFVQRGLEAALLSEDVTQDVVRNTTAVVAGQLTYLVMTAKTKSRNAIMKSRKNLVTATVYGERPVRTVRSTEPGIQDVILPHAGNLRLFSDEEVLAAVKVYGDRWLANINTAIMGLPEDSEEEDEAKIDTIYKMLKAWKAGEVQPVEQA